MKSSFTFLAIPLILGSSVFGAAISGTSSTYATRSDSQPSITDADVLNFALTLEHLENTFYTQGLANFSDQAFKDAGYSDEIRGRYVEIAKHEATHVKFLTAVLEALGAKAVEPCTYDFSASKDPKSFVALSAAFETVGTSAYAGAAALIYSKDILTAAASILAIEARQSSWIQSFAQHVNPWSGSFEIPLTADEVITLAQPFIVSCPPSNPPLIAKPFPELVVTPSNPQPGEEVTLTFDYPSSLGSKSLYVVFLTSDGAEFVPIESGKKTVTLPDNLRGTVFAIVTTCNDAEDLKKETIVAGPALLMFPFDAWGNPIKE